MTMTQCYLCSKFDLKTAGSEMAKHGYGLCHGEQPLDRSRFRSAVVERECRRMEAAGDEVAGKRAVYLKLALDR